MGDEWCVRVKMAKNYVYGNVDKRLVKDTERGIICTYLWKVAETNYGDEHDNTQRYTCIELILG